MPEHSSPGRVNVHLGPLLASLFSSDRSFSTPGFFTSNDTFSLCVRLQGRVGQGRYRMETRWRSVGLEHTARVCGARSVPCVRHITSARACVRHITSTTRIEQPGQDNQDQTKRQRHSVCLPSPPSPRLSFSTRLSLVRTSRVSVVWWLVLSALWRAVIVASGPGPVWLSPHTCPAADWMLEARVGSALHKR